MSDNPIAESGALDTNQAATAFASLLGGDEPPKEPEAQAPEDPDAAAVELAAQEQQGEPQGEKKYTVKVDGKEVEVPLEELLNGYQRQADYTQKTMAAADARKAAEAESNQARQERQQYAQQLQVMAAQLQGALQTPPDLGLLNSDPIEYMRQRHQYESWQAQLSNVHAEAQKVDQIEKAERQKHDQEYTRQQHQALLDKLPEWKDAKKAGAESAAIAKYLSEELGYTPQELGQLNDHRHVVMAREAMKYRELMAKAKDAAKKISAVPAKVERPGNAEVSKPDGRSSAMQRLSKSGRVEDAASVFASFL